MGEEKIWWKKWDNLRGIYGWCISSKIYRFLFHLKKCLLVISCVHIALTSTSASLRAVISRFKMLQIHIVLLLPFLMNTFSSLTFGCKLPSFSLQRSDGRQRCSLPKTWMLSRAFLDSCLVLQLFRLLTIRRLHRCVCFSICACTCFFVFAVITEHTSLQMCIIEVCFANWTDWTFLRSLLLSSISFLLTLLHILFFLCLSLFLFVCFVCTCGLYCTCFCT